MWTHLLTYICTVKFVKPFNLFSLQLSAAVLSFLPLQLLMLLNDLHHSRVNLQNLYESMGGFLVCICACVHTCVCMRVCVCEACSMTTLPSPCSVLEKAAVLSLMKCRFSSPRSSPLSAVR